MKNYCIQNGYSPDSFQGQVSFMVYELADYPELVTFLKTATDPQLSAQEFVPVMSVQWIPVGRGKVYGKPLPGTPEKFVPGLEEKNERSGTSVSK